MNFNHQNWQANSINLSTAKKITVSPDYADTYITSKISSNPLRVYESLAEKFIDVHDYSGSTGADIDLTPLFQTDFTVTETGVIDLPPPPDPTLNQTERDRQLQNCLESCDLERERDTRNLEDETNPDSMENKRRQAEYQKHKCLQELNDELEGLYRSWDHGLGGELRNSEYWRSQQDVVPFTPRGRVNDALSYYSYCAMRQCIMLDPYNDTFPTEYGIGESGGRGWDIPSGMIFPGPNLCLNDVQKAILKRIIDLKNELCISNCSGPFGPRTDCPQKDSRLISICKLEALLNYRCNLLKLNQKWETIECQVYRDTASDIIQCYNRSYGNPSGGITSETLPISPEFYACSDELAKKRNEALEEIFKGSKEEYLKLYNDFINQMNSCGCTGEASPSIEEIMGPMLLPHYRGVSSYGGAEPPSPYYHNPNDGEIRPWDWRLLRFRRDSNAPTPWILPDPIYDGGDSGNGGIQ